MGLVEWSGMQAAWVGDSLRRIAVSQHFEPSEEDESAILARVRHAAAGGSVSGQADGLVCSPLDAAHLSGGHVSPGRVVIAELGPVQHVDRLAAGQVLRFAPIGITLVFGENGSGKSGYTRIAKRFCRSLSIDELKGDVFLPSAPQQMAIHVKYKVGGDEIVGFDWEPGLDTPAELKQISVFDSHNARLYVDQQNRIAYLPAEIAILERHGAVCDKLSTRLTAESAELERRLKVPLPMGYSPGSSVDAILARLAPKAQLPTREDIERLAGLTADEEAELLVLERELAEDPAVAASAKRAAKKALARVSTIFQELDFGLATGVTADIARLRADLDAAVAAAGFAAAASFGSEPLPAVGDAAWRQLYDAALRYVASFEPLSFGLPASAGDACLLCQEPLNATGADRIARFNAFVSGEAARRADEARTVLEAAIQRLESLVIPPSDVVVDTLGLYAASRTGRQAVVDEIAAALAAYAERKNQLVASAKGATVAVPELPAPLTARLKPEMVDLEAEAVRLDAAAVHSQTIDAKRSRLASLKDRKKLKDDLATVLLRLDDLTVLTGIAACKAQLATRSISAQVSALRKKLVTEKLEARIRGEIASLDLGHIPFAFSDSSQQGISRFGVGLQGATRHKNTQVLSEGEQRALALACFLAEIGDEAEGYGIIVDDPVSSLDQARIRRVAARLVAEARKGRQVVIFTHSLVFFNEVVAEAARFGPEAPLLTNVIRKTEAGGFGIVEQDSEPWIVRGINLRIDDLRERAKAMAAESSMSVEDFRRRAKDFYSDLRESWERAVEEIVFNRTVERLVPDVKTQSLKGVSVTDDDYRTIYFAMKRASERSGHDMAAGRDIPVPTPADMLADIEELDRFRIDYTARRKALTTARSAMEAPVKASPL